jgi:hypothetical protein
MDRALLLRYLKHLDTLVDGLQKKEFIDIQDIAPVRSEFRAFRARVEQAPELNAALRSRFGAIEVQIDDRFVEGSGRTKLLNLYAAVGGDSPFLRAWRAKNKEKIAPELTRLRDEIRNLATALGPQ